MTECEKRALALQIMVQEQQRFTILDDILTLLRG